MVRSPSQLIKQVDELADEAEVEAAKRSSFGHLLLKAARLFNERAIARVRAQTRADFRAPHTALLPHIDFAEATRLAVGRAWREATGEQKKRLVEEFRRMLVRTYSNAIQSYQGQTLKVLPSRGKQAEDDTTVRTQFIRAGGKPLPSDFQMHKTDKGWKI